MAKTSTGLAAAHLAVRAYASRHGLEPAAFRSDGRVTLTFDENIRVTLQPAAEGRLAITAMVLNLMDLPSARADDALLRLAGWGSGMLREHASTLALDNTQQRLVLQQLLPASADVALLETELAGFLNVLAFWSRTAAQEASRVPA